MKSRITNEKNNEIILSIGMIVKNEEKVLRRCLESLKPLMEQIPSELIIADTGSVDSTMDIAREYTDIVYAFDWIDDFSAARNSTLKRANGKWFMYIDADEYLDENIIEMVDFFRISELNEHYNTVQIMIRSYTNKDKTKYQDACLPRIYKMYDGIKFIGAIHEGIGIMNPLGYFSTIVHHTGYFFESYQERAKKRDRNLSLMFEEYERNQENMRIISLIIAGTTDDDSRREFFVKKGISLALKNRKHIYADALLVQGIEYLKSINPVQALELIDDYYINSEVANENVATVEVCMLKSEIYQSLLKYDDACNSFKQYSTLYKRYKENKLNISALSTYSFIGLTDSEYMENVFKISLIMKQMKKYDEALELLSQFSLSELQGENFRKCLGAIREICREKKDYRYMANIYQEVQKFDDRDKLHLVLFMLESTYNLLDNKEKRDYFALSISESGCTGKYVDLMKLSVNTEVAGFIERLKCFIDSVDDWSDGYSEAIYLAVKYKVDISDVVLKVDSATFRCKLEEIAINNDDFAGYVLEYGMPESYMASIKQFFWLVSLYEKASYRCFSLDDGRKMELYQRFILLLGDYVMNIYNPELLNDEDIDVLSGFHKFGYYMSKAFECLNNNDKSGYIRKMKKALVSCESMKEIVQFLLEQFKKTM